MGSFTASPHPWSVGETVTAANLNTQLYDLVNAFQAWTAYSPVWTAAGTAPSLGNGTLRGAYVEIGKLVSYRFALVAGSSTTFGTSTWYFTLPVAPLAGGAAGVGFGTPAGVRTGFNPVHQAAGDTRVFLIDTPAGGLVSNTAPRTWANTNSLQVHGTYEAE